jgi:hypothetical protein
MRRRHVADPAPAIGRQCAADRLSKQSIPSFPNTGGSS